MTAFVRGLVFSGGLLDGCKALQEQLQLLHWGGLRLAVLRSAAEATSAKPASACSYECIDVLTCGGGVEAAEVAVQGWAAGQGLQWPAEVVVLGAAGDAVAVLGRALQQRQGQGSGDELLPGCSSEAGGGAVAAAWPRLRLALAHANFRRAQAEAGGSSGRRKRARKEEGSAGGHEGKDSSGGGDDIVETGAAAGLVVVGYAMKASRERDLAKEGLLNLVPQDGVVFAPLDLSAPLESQLPFHALLHKASDELEYGPPPPPPAAEGAAAEREEEAAAAAAAAACLVPRFGPRVRAMAEFVARHGGVSLVDPLEATSKVINRTELARVCDSLSAVDLSTPEAGDGAGVAARTGPSTVGAVVVRAPRSITVTSFAETDVAAAVERIGCSAPFIVKPVVACGTPDSHTMALALWPSALAGLAGRVPLPAVVQEFVNHDAIIYKVYVAGDKVFHTVRPSIPNVPCSRPEAEALAPDGLLFFDSLKSLPTTLPSTSTSPTTASNPSPNLAAAAASPGPKPTPPTQLVLERLAAHLRAALGLSLFGFDVVVVAAPLPSSLPDATSLQGGAEGGAGPGGQAEAQAMPGLQAGPAVEAGARVQELVVVDVNYFPSYRGAEGAAALFRSAVLSTHAAQVAKRR